MGGSNLANRTLVGWYGSRYPAQEDMAERFQLHGRYTGLRRSTGDLLTGIELIR